jgi:hypothetical protein
MKPTTAKVRPPPMLQWRRILWMHDENMNVTVPFFNRLLRLPPFSPSSGGWLPLRESRLSWLNCLFNIGFDVKPLRTGAELRPDGLYSGVFLADDIGLSKGLRGGGVKLLLSSRSRRPKTGVKLAGVELTGVKPEFTGVKPDVTGFGFGATGGSSIGIFFMPLSNSSFIIFVFNASDARIAGDSPRRLDGVCCTDRFIGEFAGDGVRGPPYSYSNCWWTPGLASRRYSS